jgi:predicted protein tyrosine phosphatase
MLLSSSVDNAVWSAVARSLSATATPRRLRRVARRATPNDAIARRWYEVG